MKQVNLVPPSVRQKALTRASIPYLVFAGLVGVGAALAAWAGFSFQVHSIQTTKDSLIQQETLRQQALAKDQSDYSIDADLTTRVSTLNGLAKYDIDWNKAFAYVADLTPKDVSLSNYSYATSQGTITLKITGVAPSNVSYATFAEYLSNSVGKNITAFRVDGYTYDAATGHVTFAITITVPPDLVKFPSS